MLVDGPPCCHRGHGSFPVFRSFSDDYRTTIKPPPPVMRATSFSINIWRILFARYWYVFQRIVFLEDFFEAFLDHFPFPPPVSQGPSSFMRFRASCVSYS